MDTLKERGIQYISGRVIGQNDAVMFDIDDTLIYTDGTPIKPMIELLYIARHLGYKIIIITARPGIKTVIARIVNDSDITYSVQFLEKNKHHLYDFVNTVEVITKEAISGFYDTNFFHS